MWAELKRVELGVGEVKIASTKTVAGMDQEMMKSHLSVTFRDVTQCRDENKQSFIGHPLVFDYRITNFTLILNFSNLFCCHFMDHGQKSLRKEKIPKIICSFNNVVHLN